MQGRPQRMYAKCRICGDETEHKLYYVKEMFFGARQEFAYFECEKCQCIQIAEIPEDMDAFYGSDYYSFSKPALKESAASKRIETRILDVGCGAGKWLADKYAEGHVNLFGCDPFLEADISYGECIHIKKCTIHELDGSFEVIRLHDSFEHVGDPLDVLISIDRLLTDSGMALVSIPVYPNAAFDIFKEDWYQWDAPRHLFLHSVKSMEFLCQKAGLRIQDINYNSDYRQFVSSLLCRSGVPYMEQSNEVMVTGIGQQQIDQFKKLTEELNRKGYGDHAVFVIVKERKGGL